MRDIELNEFERTDDLNRNGYKIIQNEKKFCFGMDSVLLSGFANVKKGEKAVDLGTGTGVIPILLCAKTQGKSYIGIEIQEECAKMAQRSVFMNELENNIEIKHLDLKNAAEELGKCAYDVVTSNPPYMNEKGGMINEYSPMAIARHEILCTLDDVVCAAASLLRFGGRFYMVHRPHRLADIFSSLRKHKLEPKRMQLVQPREGKEPNMVLIEASKQGRPMLKVLPPLVIYDNDGNYTKSVRQIYEE
ncbi:MAG: tRNA1(Val) (adenine(37)-N6)-methyltransferase [Firmicutes bacterium]|nr:tRNA1(Val) (adenine(37)-N6)-methyltransferase [Bacillota bacterium]